MLAVAKRKQTRTRTIGPADHGRSMSLRAFDRVRVESGYLYELAQGRIEVSEIPSYLHGTIVRTIHKLIERYDDQNPGLIAYVAGGAEAKVMVNDMQSERHPDLAIYLSAPPEEKNPWSSWVPAIVIEVVSESSAKRDYNDKPEEYRQVGVLEYWIVDPIKHKLTVKSRYQGRFKDTLYKPTQTLKTHLQPGFAMPLKSVVGKKSK